MRSPDTDSLFANVLTVTRRLTDSSEGQERAVGATTPLVRAGRVGCAIVYNGAGLLAVVEWIGGGVQDHGLDSRMGVRGAIP